MKTVNIIIIGKVKSGKSALANVLLDKENEFSEDGSSESITREFQNAEFDHGGIKYRIIDTISFGVSLEEIKFEKIIEIYNKFKGDGLLIFFLIRGRIVPFEINIYKELKHRIFGDKFVDHLTIVRTDFSNFKDPKEQEMDKEGLKKVEANWSAFKIGGTKFISTCCPEKEGEKERIVYVDNPPIDIIGNENRVKLNKKKREESRIRLLKYLENVKVNPFSEELETKKIKQAVAEIKKISDKLQSFILQPNKNK